MSLGGAALREARAELAEARKQWHVLQVEIGTLHALVRETPTNTQTHTRRITSEQPTSKSLLWVSGGTVFGSFTAHQEQCNLTHLHLDRAVVIDRLREIGKVDVSRYVLEVVVKVAEAARVIVPVLS